jgi:DNA polymerase I-like protein with 3'-5' exonuclease and polymerase domains
MLETYRVGGDIHDQTATVIFGGGKHGKEQRTIAKNVNFGTFYGLFPRGLQKTLKFKAGLDTSLPDCEKIISNLKAGYPALTRWQEETKQRAGLRRYTETWLGRRRYLPDIISPDWGKKSFAERCSLNTPIQGTAADILKLALARIIAGLLKSGKIAIMDVVEELDYRERSGNKWNDFVAMDDPYTKLTPGERGTVDFVDDTATVHIRWDCGAGLGAVYGVDVIKKI